MLAIRMQRTGRKGHAMFRVIVQDARRTPTSGKVVAQIGSYDPHSKAIVLQKDKADYYLEHGAQPSERVVRLLVSEGVKLPDWVKQSVSEKQRTTRNPEKLRRNRSAEVVKADADVPETSDVSEVTTAEAKATADQSEEQISENSEKTDSVEDSTETNDEKENTEAATQETSKE